jgi:hypothetical protein
MASVAIATAAASGHTVLVSGVAAKQIRTHAFVYQLSGTTAVTFKSGSTALSGAMAGVSGSVVASAYSPEVEPAPTVRGGCRRR